MGTVLRTLLALHAVSGKLKIILDNFSTNGTRYYVPNCEERAL